MPGLLATSAWSMILYDQAAIPLMNAPVPDFLIVDEPIVNNADPINPMPGVFPCPGVLYSVNSLILLDLYANTFTNTGDIWQIVLHGAERVPVKDWQPEYTEVSLRTPYLTPAGCRDRPFIYVFNPDGLGFGAASNQQYLSQKIHGDSDFVLRRVAGWSSFASRFNYRNPSFSSVFSVPLQFATAAGLAGKNSHQDMAVVPEKLYPAAGQISFDLFGIGLGATGSNGLIFQGAKRFQGELSTGVIPATGSAYRPNPCPYKLRSYEYTIAVTANFAPPVFRRVSAAVENREFELYRITQVDITGGGGPGGGGLPM